MANEARGAIEILCKEINAIFTQNMESTAVLVGFISAIVSEIDGMVRTARQLSQIIGEDVPDETEEALEAVKNVLKHSNREELIKAEARARRTVYVLDEGPCNHYVDMLSSCLSAIKFGLERPCLSRHPADAADHVWKRKYGISLFDRHTSAWRKQWTRDKLYEALSVAATGNNQATETLNQEKKNE